VEKLFLAATGVYSPSAAVVCSGIKKIKNLEAFYGKK
jgi:hypothetical protein